MENKYYTPEIEEFHIGFEFEYKKYRDVWVKSSFDKSHLEEGFDTYSIFRVKYLDKEDIESLGWEFKEEYHISDYPEDKIELGSICYSYTFKKGMLLKYTPKYKRLLVENLKNKSRFSGNIKNKSELKRLMKQLGIWNK